MNQVIANICVLQLCSFSGGESSSGGNGLQDQFAQKMEEQLQRLKEDHKKELGMVRQTASRTMADALNEQEKQLSTR